MNRLEKKITTKIGCHKAAIFDQEQIISKLLVNYKKALTPDEQMMLPDLSEHELLEDIASMPDNYIAALLYSPEAITDDVVSAGDDILKYLPGYLESGIPLEKALTNIRTLGY